MYLSVSHLLHHFFFSVPGHGVTQHSSNLVYSGQPGGLNEGFSDILGTTVEFIVNDANDQPDFTIAEQAGQVLRNMEYPIGRSLGSICEYTASLQVHFSSGALNKAFVKSIRACRASACDNLYGCTVLMGTSFLYSNIHGLTRTSTFLEGAEATCKLVDEFLTVRSPITRCTASQVKQFVREGWATVDVALSDDCVASETCVEPTAAPTKSPSASPSSLPSSATSETSSAAPSGTPSEVPSLEPSMIPSGAQSSNPSILPSLQPSAKVFQSGTREPSTPAIEGIESKEPGDTAPTTEQPLPVPSTLVPTTIEPATFNPTTFAPSTNEPTNPPSALFEPTQSANSPSSPIATVTRRPTQAPIATVAPRPTEAPIATVAPRPDRVPTRTQQEDDTPSSATNTTQEDVRGFCFAKFTNFFRRVITLDWV